jgi:hypothetical protein
MKLNKIFTALIIFLLSLSTSAAFLLRDGVTNPEFVAPGSTFDIEFQGMHDVSGYMYVGGVFSVDKVWDLLDDQLVIYKGGEGSAPLDPDPADVNFLAFKSPAEQEELGMTRELSAFQDASWTVTLPSKYKEGDELYIIIRVLGGPGYMSGVKATPELIIPIIIDSQRDVIFNTANMGEKRATGKLVVKVGVPKAVLVLDTVSSLTTSDAGLDVSPDTIVFKSRSLDIYFATDGDKVEYTINGADKNTGSTFNLGSVSDEIIVIEATATGTGLSSISREWVFKRELPEIDLRAEAVLVGGDGGDSTATANSVDEIIHFGHETTVELISEEAPNIKWIFGESVEYDDSDSDWEEFDKSSPITIAASDPDTVYITGYAYGGDFDPGTNTFCFVRDTVAVLLISGETKFFESTNAKISVDPTWQNQKIYYTTDVDEEPTASSTEYDGSISISSTTTIRAIAYGDNAVESKIVEVTFTQVAGVESAWYRDANGDGSIDEVVIDLTLEVSDPPTELELISPFDSAEMVSDFASIEVSDDKLQLVASFETPFSFADLSTHFEIAKGTLNGTEYWDYKGDDTQFEIADSVAPIIIAARYKPTEVKEGDESEVLLDKLVLTFSEEMAKPATEKSKPFDFWDNSEDEVVENPLEVIEELEREGAVIIYSIAAKNYYLPENGADSVRIKGDGEIIGSTGSEQTVDSKWVALSVDAYTYKWQIQPFPNPYSHSTPIERAIADTVFGSVVDNPEIVIGIFVTPIGKRVLTGTIEATLVILDALGNVVHTASGDEFVAIEDGALEGSFVHTMSASNEAGRKLASGAYVARINLILKGTDGSESDESQETFLIGIKN